MATGEAKGKLLFSVRGFASKPHEYMENTIANAQKDFNKFRLIPVIWPSEGDLTKYYEDHFFSESVGKLLQSITPTGQNETISKSVLCHSMGNRVLRYFASKKGLCWDGSINSLISVVNFYTLISKTPSEYFK